MAICRVTCLQHHLSIMNFIKFVASNHLTKYASKFVQTVKKRLEKKTQAIHVH